LICILLFIVSLQEVIAISSLSAQNFSYLEAMHWQIMTTDYKQTNEKFIIDRISLNLSSSL